MDDRIRLTPRTFTEKPATTGPLPNRECPTQAGLIDGLPGMRFATITLSDNIIGCGKAWRLSRYPWIPWQYSN